jgi:hypothetical protein
MAGEQAALALAAGRRFFEEEAPLYEIKPYYYDDFGNASAWAREGIILATGRGIVMGSGGYFRPQSGVTRAEFAAMLVRLTGLGPAASPGAAPFFDVPEGAWYGEAVAAAYENGLITGYGGAFYPERGITREEMAVMMARALSLPAGAGTGGLSDFDAVSPWARESVASVCAAGLMTGDGDRFSPAAPVTREMAALVCVRAAA